MGAKLYIKTFGCQMNDYDSGKMAAAAGNTPFDKLPVQGRCLALFKGGRLVDQRSG